MQYDYKKTDLTLRNDGASKLFKIWIGLENRPSLITASQSWGYTSNKVLKVSERTNMTLKASQLFKELGETFLSSLASCNKVTVIYHSIALVMELYFFFMMWSCFSSLSLFLSLSLLLIPSFGFGIQANKKWPSEAQSLGPYFSWN